MFSAPVTSYFQSMENKWIRFVSYFGAFFVTVLAFTGCQSPSPKHIQSHQGNTAQVLPVNEGISDELMQQFRIMISVRGETVREAVTRMMKRDLKEFEICQANKERLLTAAGLVYEPQSGRDTVNATRFYPHIYKTANYQYFYIFPSSTLSFEIIECSDTSIPVMVIYKCPDTGTEGDTIKVFPLKSNDYEYSNLTETNIREIQEVALPIEECNPDAEAQILGLLFPH